MAKCLIDIESVQYPKLVVAFSRPVTLAYVLKHTMTFINSRIKVAR